MNLHSAEQTDLKINDVVGLELFVETLEGGRATRDISHPPLYGTVDIYLVHSHDLFLRDMIDAKGHQGVKGDTSMLNRSNYNTLNCAALIKRYRKLLYNQN